MRTAGWGGRGTLDRGFVAGTIRCAFARQRKPHDEPWSCGTNPRIRARSTVVHASCRPHWAPIYPKCHLPRRDGLTCLSLDITDIRARCVGQDVALAALDLLAGVIPSRAAGFGGLDRLAVDDPGGGTRFAAHRFTRQHQQDMVDLPPQAVVAPGIEVVLHRGKGREILGQHAPLAAALGDVEDGVHHRSQRRRAPPPAPLVRRWHQRRDHRPFAIGGVACIAKPTPLILRSSDFCPHLVPPSSLANTTESQDTEITHLNFGSASKTLTSSGTKRGFFTRQD